MSTREKDSANDLGPNELRLDHLLGRRVFDRNNESIGRLEEIRTAKHGTGSAVTGYVIGRAGLLERLGVGARLLVGRHKGGGYFVRWDQLDIGDPGRPRLRCPTRELEQL